MPQATFFISHSVRLHGHLLLEKDYVACRIIYIAGCVGWWSAPRETGGFGPVGCRIVFCTRASLRTSNSIDPRGALHRLAGTIPRPPWRHKKMPHAHKILSRGWSPERTFACDVIFCVEITSTYKTMCMSCKNRLKLAVAINNLCRILVNHQKMT
jgi:hypothetical protein